MVLLKQAEILDFEEVTVSSKGFLDQEISIAFPLELDAVIFVVAHRDGCMQHTAASRDPIMIVCFFFISY